MQNASTTPRTATVKWTDMYGNELDSSNNDDSVNFQSSTHKSNVYYTIQYSDGSTPITQNFYINTYNAYKAGIDYATPISIDRRINLANNEPMPDTWNNGKGYIYVRAQNSDGGVYKDETIEVTTDSAIYQAGLAAGGGSMRTATVKWTDMYGNELDSSNNDDSVNFQSSTHKSNVYYTISYSDGTSSIQNFYINTHKAYQAGVSAGYTNTQVTFSSNNTYTPGSNVRWSSVTVDVPVRTATVQWTDINGNLLNSFDNDDSVNFLSSNSKHRSSVYYKISYSDGTSSIQNFFINTHNVYMAGLNAGSGTSSGSWKAPEPILVDILPETELVFTDDYVSYWADEKKLVGVATVKHGSSTLDFTVYMPTDQVPTSGGSGSGSSSGSDRLVTDVYWVWNSNYSSVELAFNHGDNQTVSLPQVYSDHFGYNVSLYTKAYWDGYEDAGGGSSGGGGSYGSYSDQILSMAREMGYQAHAGGWYESDYDASLGAQYAASSVKDAFMEGWYSYYN